MNVALKDPLSTPLEPPASGWALAILPDTQRYASEYPEVFMRQVEWIAANREAQNIRFTVHLGDITENNAPAEWQLARRAMDALKAGRVPYLLALGNHDLTNGCRETLLNDYFTPADYGEVAGFFKPGRLENSWREFSSMTGDFLVLALEFAPRDEVLEWANEVVASRPDRQVIVLAHAYLYWDGTRFDWEKYGATQEYSPVTYIGPEHGASNDGETIWRKFVSRHPNIAFVLSGHVLGGGAAHLVSLGAGGQRVHQMVTNFQPGVVPDRGYGGGGFLRLLRFAPGSNLVQVRTYSPWYDRWLDDEPPHCFEFPLC